MWGKELGSGWLDAGGGLRGCGLESPYSPLSGAGACARSCRDSSQVVRESEDRLYQSFFSLQVACGRRIRVAPTSHRALAAWLLGFESAPRSHPSHPRPYRIRTAHTSALRIGIPLRASRRRALIAAAVSTPDIYSQSSFQIYRTQRRGCISTRTPRPCTHHPRTASASASTATRRPPSSVSVSVSASPFPSSSAPCAHPSPALSASSSPLPPVSSRITLIRTLGILLPSWVHRASQRRVWQCESREYASGRLVLAVW
ncbi:hypothetical protein B0H11DRAFT_2032588 [Mycena galericulata]|nr:hypothetical protein B0H11DRAFT_2032588 [Mycena galericulata]